MAKLFISLLLIITTCCITVESSNLALTFDANNSTCTAACTACPKESTDCNNQDNTLLINQLLNTTQANTQVFNHLLVITSVSQEILGTLKMILHISLILFGMVISVDLLNKNVAKLLVFHGFTRFLPLPLLTALS